MKQFLLKAALFFLIGFILLNFVVSPLIIKFLFTHESLETVFSNVPTIMYRQLSRSKKETSAGTVLLGESVASQLIDETLLNGNIYSLSVYQSCSMAGQYILANNIISTNSPIKRLILLYQPRAFRHNLNKKSTYNNFVNPFYTFTYLPLLSPTVIDRLNQHAFCRLGILPALKVTKYCSWVDYTDEARDDIYYLSPISVEYLAKIRHLTQKAGIDFLVLPTPVSKGKYINKDYSYFMQQLKDNDLTWPFRAYFDNLTYYEDALFYDGFHFSEDRLEAQRIAFANKLKNFLPPN